MSVLSTITRHLPHRITTGAMADEFGGTDASGYQIASFTPSVVETIRLAATVAALESLYRTQPSVRICVSFLAQAIAPLNIKLFRGMSNGEQTRVYTHPLEDLLQRPNPRTSRFELFRDTTSDVAIYDNAYWLKQFTRRGDRRLYRLPPTWVTPQGGSVITGPGYYELRNPGSGELTRYEPDEIVHFHGYNPIDGRVGMSALQALHYVLNEDLQASRNRVSFWKDGAQQDTIIERPPATESGEWSEVARNRFKEEWRDAYSGPHNAGNAPILEDGMKVNRGGWSPKDSEFIAGREFTLDIVATAYHIPLTVLSRKGTATFASAKEFHKMLYVDTLGPWTAMFESAIALQLIPDFDTTGSLFAKFNIDEKLEGDFEQQAEAARQSVQVPWMSVDDMRAKRGMEPLGGVYAEPARPSTYLYGDEEREGTANQEPEPADDGGATLEVAATNGHRAIEELAER